MCHASLYRFARALAGDPSVAEDLVQETYRRALNAGNKPDQLSPEQLRPWLFTILRNVWLNSVRSASRENPLELNVDHASPAETDSPEWAIHQKLLRSEIVQAIDALPEQFRRVFVLRELEELSYAQIAEIAQCPVGTVMSRLARARQILRHSLMAYHPAGRKVKQ
jgi:RNA polymerase sigma-70 factor (ECF subfamily)